MNETKLQLIIEALNKTDSAFNALKGHLKGSQDETDKLNVKSKDLTATIQRLALSLVSVGAALTAIKSGINYLAQIETSGLGIAAAFMTGGKYIDATSKKALSAQDALNEAQRDSTGIIENLQYANLQTIATLDQLIRAYQETLPVAMAKGFNRKQVEEYTVAMVQAAGAIGLQMDMLAEETRSLLLGTINPRTSRIATVLGLRNEDIEKFKGNANGLFDFLMGKLSAYQVAGVAAQNTWAGLWSNTKDIVSQALGRTLEPLFEAVKYELKDLADSIVTIDDKAKKIKWNPEFLAGVADIKAGVTSIIAEVYRLGMLLDKAGITYKEYRSRVYSATGFSADSNAEGKKADEYRARYMKSEKALQDLAMREQGWKPVTPDIDKQMRDAAAKGKKLFEQSQINVGEEYYGTKQLLRYYRETGTKQKADYQPNPVNDEDEKLKKLAKEWGKTSRDLSTSINKEGLDDFGKKVEDITNKAADLAEKFGKVPGAQKEITKWAESSINQAFLEETLKTVETERKAGEGRIKNREDLEKQLTAVTASEITKRLNSVKEEAVKQQELADAAYDRSTPEGAKAYQDAIINIERAATEKRKKIQAEYNSSVREAQINSQLAALDLAEKEGTAHRDTIEERIRLTRELIGIQEQYLATLDKSKDPTAWYAQLDAINKIKVSLAGLEDEQAPVFAALRNYADGAGDVYKNLGSAITSTFKNIEDTLVEFVTTGKASFTDFANSVIKDLVRIMIQKNITGPLASFGSSWLQGLFGSGTTTATSAAASTSTIAPLSSFTMGFGSHAGGIMGKEPTFYRIVPSAAFANAPRYHTGIGPGERTAIIKDDEGVFTEGQMKAMGIMANNSGRQNIRVELVNQSGTSLQSTKSETKFNGQEYVVTVFLDALNRNAYGLRNALGGA